MKIKKNLALFTACTFTLSCCAVNAFASQNNTLDTTDTITKTNFDNYSGNELLVLHKDGSTETKSYSSKAEMEKAAQNISKQSDVDIVQPNYTYTNTAVSVDDKLYPKQWALSNDGSFTMVESKNDYPVYNDPFGDPSMPGQWHIPDFGYVMPWSRKGGASGISSVAGIDINVQQAWNNYTDSKQVVVALIDTGIDYEHEDLSSNILWENSGETANGKDDDQNGYVDDINGWNFYDNNNQIYVNSNDSHGTHCAGTILADSNNSTGIAGIDSNTDVKIMALKALGGSEGTGTTESVINAIKYAEANGATICNLSLGTSQSDEALYKTIAESNMLFVIAAGNGDDNSGYGQDNDKNPTYPASFDLDNIISVANIQPDGNLNSTSNYGKKSVDIAAPGTYILSTTPDNSYSYMTGTSMAAPMVTAVCAMVSSKYDSATLKDVKDIVLNSAQKLDTLSSKVLTGGMLDAGAAMSSDVSALSHSEWTKPDLSNYTDTENNTSTSSDGPKFDFSVSGTTLNVNVSDSGHKIKAVRYSYGNHTSDEFDGGKYGNEVTLDDDNNAYFQIQQGGEYTFYAIDSAGNEKVSAIDVTVDDDNNFDFDNFFNNGGFENDFRFYFGFEK